MLLETLPLDYFSTLKDFYGDRIQLTDLCVVPKFGIMRGDLNHPLITYITKAQKGSKVYYKRCTLFNPKEPGQFNLDYLNRLLNKEPVGELIEEQQYFPPFFGPGFVIRTQKESKDNGTCTLVQDGEDLKEVTEQLTALRIT